MSLFETKMFKRTVDNVHTMSALSSNHIPPVPPPKPQQTQDTAIWDSWRRIIDSNISNEDDRLFAQTLLEDVFIEIEKSTCQSFKLQVVAPPKASEYAMHFIVGDTVDLARFAALFKEKQIYNGSVTCTHRGLAGTDFAEIAGSSRSAATRQSRWSCMTVGRLLPSDHGWMAPGSQG